MPRYIFGLVLLLVSIARAETPAAATQPSPLPKAAGAYVATGEVVKTPFATQAAAADEQFVYAISSTQVVKYDRATGKELGKSIGEAHHLNSGFVLDGKIYCAHSNFPKKPDESDIRVLDPATMQLTVFHAFENPPGSLTWCVKKPKDDGWWCHFAQYGKNNSKSVLVHFDANWKELARWTSPPELVSQWGNYSLSGGIWQGDKLLVTGHDKRFIYRLRLPKDGTVLEVVTEVPSPFPGQGIAADPKTGGLVGISRDGGKVLFAKYEKEGK